jgi:serine/threonine-protein kinase HipA
MQDGDRCYGVWLNDEQVGTLNQRGDYTWFLFSPEYLLDPNRSVLGLVFEQDPGARHASALRLPPWFSNLLPEGRLREWIATDRHVSIEREMELLAQVGHDLPGAVRVLLDDRPPEDEWHAGVATTDPYAGRGEPRDDRARGWRFSLAGISLKFSMLRKDDRLTLPAFGEGGDWIVKLPDRAYRNVPLNEYAMMSLAAEAGIEVPDRLLVDRDQLDDLPPNVWPGDEDLAYAVRRFDRDDQRRRVHIEDFAQVRNIYPDEKYRGNFDTLASLIYRRHDLASLREFARRMAFNVLITNGDAHLKNWSLIYRDRRVPSLAPAYDLVSTGVYRVGDEPEDLGLRFGGTRRFDDISLTTFARLERRLGISDGSLCDSVVETVDRVRTAWPSIEAVLANDRDLRHAVSESIAHRHQTLLRRRP